MLRGGLPCPRSRRWAVRVSIPAPRDQATQHPEPERLRNGTSPPASPVGSNDVHVEPTKWRGCAGRVAPKGSPRRSARPRWRVSVLAVSHHGRSSRGWTTRAFSAGPATPRRTTRVECPWQKWKRAPIIVGGGSKPDRCRRWGPDSKGERAIADDESPSRSRAESGTIASSARAVPSGVQTRARRGDSGALG